MVEYTDKTSFINRMNSEFTNSKQYKNYVHRKCKDAKDIKIRK